jgi:hypothetical protein
MKETNSAINSNVADVKQRVLHDLWLAHIEGTSDSTMR